MNSFEIEREIQNSKGYQVAQRVREFLVSTSIFNKNYLELESHINAELEPEYYYKLQHKRYHQEREDGQLETVRLIHNYLASASSLVDHTRNYYTKYYGNDNLQFGDYQAEVEKRFALNPLANFVKCFRQYIQHFQPSFIAYESNLTDSAKGLKAKIILSKKNLLIFKNWNAKAKQYLSELENDLDIKVMALNYHLLVKEFYDWFVKRPGEIHNNELSLLPVLQRKLKKQRLKEMIDHYTTVDSFNNTIFKETVREMYNLESKIIFDALTNQKQLESMIFSLKTDGIIDYEQEIKIRERYFVI